MLVIGEQERASTGLAPTALFATLIVAMALGTTSCNSGSTAEAQPPPPPAPATVVDNTRVSDPTSGFVVNSDFTRVFFLPTTLAADTVKNIGRTTEYQNKLIMARAFMTATILYQPPLPAIDDAHFVGGDDPDSNTNDLVAMRCRPSAPSQLRPTIASWPNVFADATSDLAALMEYTPDDCPTPDLDDTYPVAQRVYCASENFSDQKSTSVPLVLQNAVDTGGTIFQFTGSPFLNNPKNTTGASVLFNLYGIGKDFSGLGYAVENSYLASEGGDVALTAAQALEQSVVTEYLVLNVPLTDAECRCVRVTPYDGRDMSLLNWDHVWSKGKLASDGSCTTRATLP
ncbi:MAG: hypothetical protein ACLQAT_17735 [Candidatus Binataceae bacterium]